MGTSWLDHLMTWLAMWREPSTATPWLYRWQTLVAGLLALVAAGWTVRATRLTAKDQIDATRATAKDQIDAVRATDKDQVDAAREQIAAVREGADKQIAAARE
jgi:hypothetical protein